MKAIDPQDLVLESRKVERQLDFERLFGWDAGIRRPVELEVGCGKGRFLVQAAGKWPERDFLAVEQARSLVRKVAARVKRLGLRNVRLCHGSALELLAHVPDASLARVHVHFPDPWPKRRHAKHRFFADPMPDVLARVLEPGGELTLATDHDPYFRGVVATLAARDELVRVLPDAFAQLPRGGFDAIFEGAGVPIFRACWQRRPG